MLHYLEQYMQDLNTLPEDTNRFLRNIREIDKKVEMEQIELTKVQRNFLQKIKQTKMKKFQNKLKVGFDVELQEIRKRQRLLYDMTVQKVKIAQDLYTLVQKPLEKLNNGLKNLYEELLKSGYLEQFQNNLNKNSIGRKNNKYERKIALKRQQNKKAINQLTELKYCYCSKPSAGQMVMCDNSLCVKQWFHVECVQEKSFGDKWYCLDCKKLRGKQQNGSTFPN